MDSWNSWFHSTKRWHLLILANTIDKCKYKHNSSVLYTATSSAFSGQATGIEWRSREFESWLWYYLGTQEGHTCSSPSDLRWETVSSEPSFLLICCHLIMICILGVELNSMNGENRPHHCKFVDDTLSQYVDEICHGGWMSSSTCQILPSLVNFCWYIAMDDWVLVEKSLGKWW